jgi:hypothetical protein
MRNRAKDTETLVQVDVIELGEETPARRVRLRRAAEPILLVLCVGAVLAVQDHEPATPGSAGSSAPAALPRLIAPAEAAAGQRITVSAFRNRRLCGATELRFDGAPITHRPAGYADPARLDRAEMFLTAWVPRSAKPGNHEITLYGPAPGGGSAPVCAEVREHQERLATTRILVHDGS